MTPDTREKDSQQDNPYLLLGFWEFGIISTLMVVFFPWSLLFCVVFFGLTETKYLVLAMLHDAIKTVGAILSVLITLAIIIFVLVLAFAN